jgi:uncharacterized protein YbjQ (UPF0145 family)
LLDELGRAPKTQLQYYHERHGSLEPTGEPRPERVAFPQSRRHSWTAHHHDGIHDRRLYRITKTFGIVRASPSLPIDLRHYRRRSSDLAGGDITLFTGCARRPGDAFDMMIAHAAEQGANAVVGVRYDAPKSWAGVTRFFAMALPSTSSPCGVKKEIR